jgi:predicted amidophosphoribosyltransferase
MKQCPNCWEPMSLTAMRCPHCGNGEPLVQARERRPRYLLWLSSLLVLASALFLLRYLGILY